VLLEFARDVLPMRASEGLREASKSASPMLLRSSEAAELLAVSERHLHDTLFGVVDTLTWIAGRYENAGIHSKPWPECCPLN